MDLICDSAGDKKGVLNTGKQELVIEEINLSKRLSCSHLFLALTADWGYTKMEVLRTFLCETCELCLHWTTWLYGIVRWPQIALEKVHDMVLYVTSCFRGLQFLWHPGYLVSAGVQNFNASVGFGA